MVDLNTLLAAIVEAQANLTGREAEEHAATTRRREATEALQDAQDAFDAAVDGARGPRAPTPGSAPAPASSRGDEAAASGDEPEFCEECGQPTPPGADHVCRTMDGAPGPLPATSPALAWTGAMPPVGFAPEPDDDREENTGAD